MDRDNIRLSQSLQGHMRLTGEAGIHTHANKKILDELQLQKSGAYSILGGDQSLSEQLHMEYLEDTRKESVMFFGFLSRALQALLWENMRSQNFVFYAGKKKMKLGKIQKGKKW